MNFLSRRSRRKKLRKHIEHAIFQVKYARRMKEDLLKGDVLERLRSLQADLKGHLKAGRLEEGVALADNAVALARDVHPAPRGAYGWRENVEVFVVVLAVALGFRTYFFQPYQIPTGSMQPTLYGITARPGYEPDWADRMPFKIGKFLLTGSRYQTVKAKEDGLMPGRKFWKRQDTFYRITIGGRTHKIHKDLLYAPAPPGHPNQQRELNPQVPRPGSAVKKGQVLAQGLLKQGDHIIVDRITPNFKRPDRGDIVVFSTTGLPVVRPNSAYIKRLVGLPGETLSIRGGKLWNRDGVIDEPEVFTRQYENPRYPGYANPPIRAYRQYGISPLFAGESQTFTLGEEEYLMMGDNTFSSLDGRYFGGVPGRNIIGLGVFVPWPFFHRGLHDDSAGPVK